MGDLACIVIVDDDSSMRASLPELVRELGYAAQAFASAEAFLDSDAALNARCLILDIGLPGMSGLELERELVRRGYTIPTIFITGRGERSIPRRVLQERGITCLFKPFSAQDLLTAIDAALQGN